MQKDDPIWDIIVEEARQASIEEPVLAAFFKASVLDQPNLDEALSFNLARQLSGPAVPAAQIAAVILQALQADASIGRSIRLDIEAAFERDAACDRHLTRSSITKVFRHRNFSEYLIGCGSRVVRCWHCFCRIRSLRHLPWIYIPGQS